MSKALLNDWMERLGLQDWTIRLQDCCDPDDMFSTDCAGCTRWTEVGKAAVIQIIDPDRYGERVGHMLIDDLARIMVALKREATD